MGKEGADNLNSSKMFRVFLDSGDGIPYDFNPLDIRKKSHCVDFSVGANKLYLIWEGVGSENVAIEASEQAKKFFINEFQNKNDISSDQIETIVRKLNRKIFERSLEDQQYTGMGLCLSLVFLTENFLFVGNAGNCNLYKLSNLIPDGIELLTVDHTLAGELKELPTREEEHQIGNLDANKVLTRYIGRAPHVDFQLRRIDLDSFINADGIIFGGTPQLFQYVNPEDLRKCFKFLSIGEDVLSNICTLSRERGNKDEIILFTLFDDASKENVFTKVVNNVANSVASKVIEPSCVDRTTIIQKNAVETDDDEDLSTQIRSVFESPITEELDVATPIQLNEFDQYQQKSIAQKNETQDTYRSINVDDIGQFRPFGLKKLDDSSLNAKSVQPLASKYKSKEVNTFGVAFRVLLGVMLGVFAGTGIGSYFYGNSQKSSNSITDRKQFASQSVSNYNKKLHEADQFLDNPSDTIKGSYNIDFNSNDAMHRSDDVLISVERIIDPELKVLFREVIMAVRETASNTEHKIVTASIQQEKISNKINNLSTMTDKLAIKQPEVGNENIGK